MANLILAEQNLAPPLLCALEVQSAIQSGETARTGAMRFVALHPNDEFSERLKMYVHFMEQGRELAHLSELARTNLQRQLFALISRSRQGEPIGSALEQIIVEMKSVSHLQMEEFLQALPVKLMLPVMLLQFPAFLILLFGPLMLDLLESLI